ncbi:MAG TPA: hypothetical protein VGJ84_20415 [Polyangiaceae bacterium]
MSAQNVVRESPTITQESVEKGLVAVGKALSVCRGAKSDREVEQLESAEKQLKAQLQVLEERATHKVRRKPTAPEIAELESKGDPNCPAGQAYNQRDTSKQIRCTGPQVIDMSWQQAKEYYSNRGYSIHGGDEGQPGGARGGATLKAEYGGELLVFTFAIANDSQPPKCLTLYPPPGTSWQEATGRVTGVQPGRLKSSTPIKAARGNLSFRVDEDEHKVVVHIGDC